ncbi:MAG: UDP-N-acetylglucosamine 2-epimerase (non-hydrolyzing) [Pyrinomonadaceae bacterium]|nr:UDP-N-acetylglucosamine 2-epimerase (non-hydrolyzing) [Pyrinomonadaceae bacterium]MCX7638948.1 UDP-N-acetylglucosamine 2-epimerase (non-hydrolyzing) [Pyrinomonadaceae bacterium]MDW8304915.1 UDP-N-acetylglucosamine 2-epimerase (non-hydrolyzing) [Acidobacteriota bacterium]
MDFIDSQKKIMVIFGTRPEAIKLAPVIHELKTVFKTVVVSTSQHLDLLKPVLNLFEIEVDHELKVMTKNQTPHRVCARSLEKLDKIITAEKPDLILVQGDTTTTLSGALAGFYHRIPVGHIEAGLRSGNIYSPFPEEMNRQLVSKIATYHFAATKGNRDNLLAEGIPTERVFVTGNPIVDALKSFLEKLSPSEKILSLIKETEGKKRVLLTTHRRESFGETMRQNLIVLRDFVAKHKNLCLIFPVHLNPKVKDLTCEVLSGQERVYLLEPLNYGDFIFLMKSSWLIVSDSGGVQEEAPSLGKPVLILRDTTERPEAIQAGVAKLVGGSPQKLKQMLETNYSVETWIKSVKEVANPFGDGRASKRILKILLDEVFQSKKSRASS